MSQTTVFADVFNQFLYHGRQVIASGNLVELDTTEISVPYGADYRINLITPKGLADKEIDEFQNFL